MGRKKSEIREVLMDVEDHPTDHIPLPSQDKDQQLDTVNSRNHDQRQCRDRLALSEDEIQ
jgi:hypothetical protein